MSEFFSQSCPTCGRSVFIRDQYAGQRVACQHCQADFLASDPSEPSGLQHHWGDALLERAEQLLALAELRLTRRPSQTDSLSVVT